MARFDSNENPYTNSFNKQPTSMQSGPMYSPQPAPGMLGPNYTRPPSQPQQPRMPTVSSLNPQPAQGSGYNANPALGMLNRQMFVPDYEALLSKVSDMLPPGFSTDTRLKNAEIMTRALGAATGGVRDLTGANVEAMNVGVPSVRAAAEMSSIESQNRLRAAQSREQMAKAMLEEDKLAPLGGYTSGGMMQRDPSGMYRFSGGMY